jgi:16S rRNA processing protein RimM
MASARDAIVVLGEVLGSYGVRGWLRVRPYTAAPETLLGFADWWVKPARGGEWRAMRRVEGRMHSGAVLAALDGLESREAALALKGALVGVPRAALPDAGDDELYWDELTGLAVLNRAGVVLGKVVGVTEHGAHPLLRVARPPGAAGQERLIPFVAAIVDRVDVAAGRIDVDWGEDY